MKNRKKVNRILPLCLVGFLVLSLAACNSQADEQNSAQPIPSTQPTAAPTPTPPSPIQTWPRTHLIMMRWCGRIRTVSPLTGKRLAPPMPAPVGK